jgi:hypothetical protein
MDNSEILHRLNAVSETLDPTIFAEIVSTIQEQIKSEKEKQEIKEIIEEVVLGLIRIVYDLEDEQVENEFYQLMEELVAIGVDVGKILMGEFKYVKNSEQQSKVIEMLEKTLKASTWIRRISFSQRLDVVIHELLLGNTPIRIKEMLTKLREQIRPYLRDKEKSNTRPISLTLHEDKTFIIHEWLKDPVVVYGDEPILIQGVSMIEFLTKEVNFEILLDYILFSHEHGPKVLAGMKQLVSYFKKFKKFNPVKKVSECVMSALSSNNSEFTALQATRLLKLVFSKEKEAFRFFLTGTCVNTFLKNFAYPEIRSFFFVFIIANRDLNSESKEIIKNKILVELFKRFSVILSSDCQSEILAVLDFLHILIPEILSDSFSLKADDFPAGEALTLGKFRLALLTGEGLAMISSIFALVFKDYWCSSNHLVLQDIQYKAGEIVLLFLRTCQVFKAIKGILTKSVNEEFLSRFQGNILHYSLNNQKSAFRLASSLVTRPVGSHMIQLGKLFSEILKFKPDLACRVSTNCWSSLMLWFFVFKNNGMFLGYIFSSLSLMFESSDEKILKEVLFDKKFLFKIIEKLSEKSEDDEKDFVFFCRKIAKKICEYTENKKNKLTKDILAVGKWRSLFPPVNENVVRSRPSSKGGSRGHTFILGLDPLQKAQPKPVQKQEHEIEFLASQLDLIYKVQ